MEDFTSRAALLLSLQRALLGEVHPQLRQASMETDAAERLVRLRFEYDGHPNETARNSCSSAATEVIADFPSDWELDEQHLAVPVPGRLGGLQHIAYRRAEAEDAT